MRRPSAGVLLAVLLAGSGGIRFAAALGLHSPWIAPDEMAYALLGRSFWTTGHMQLLDGSSPSYGFFPLVAGWPLALFGPATGLAVLKAFEVALMTSAALVVYVWVRGPAGRGWALAAAAVTAALPALAYSGLVMSETAFFPATTLTLWLLSRALVEPSLRNQALVILGTLLAVAMRFQGVVLIPAIVVAAGLMAWFSGDRTLLRRLRPTLAVLGVGVLLWAALVSLSSANVLGAYSVVGHRGYAFVPALRWIVRHAGDTFLVVLGVPLVAALIVVSGAVRSTERDPRVRALVAVTLGYVPLLIVQVGIFASRFVGQLAERDLVTVAPPLIAAFGVWLGRGLPRPQPSSSLAALLVLAPALALPVDKLANTFAVPSAFMTIPLLSLAERTSGDTMRLAWLLGATALVIITLFLPSRAAPLLVAILIVCLAGSSVLAQKRIDRRASGDRSLFFGTSSPRWIDRAATMPVAYVDDGDGLWNAAWHVAFWNERVRTIVALGPTPGPLPGAVAASARPDGRLDEPDGSPLGERLVVTRRWVTLADAQKVKNVAQGPNEPGLTLWRTASAPTLSTWTQGVLRHDELSSSVTVTVYNCRSGRLRLSVFAKEGLPSVTLSGGGLGPVTVPVPPNAVLHGWIPAPPPSRGARECVFTIAPQGVVETAGIVFERSSTAAIAAAAHREASGVTIFMHEGKTALRRKENLAYCVAGAFQIRPAGRYPDATPALYVTGKGLTCDQPPPGYVHKGFASSDLSVPANTYPLYGPP